MNYNLCVYEIPNTAYSRESKNISAMTAGIKALEEKGFVYSKAWWASYKGPNGASIFFNTMDDSEEASEHRDALIRVFDRAAAHFAPNLSRAGKMNFCNQRRHDCLGCYHYYNEECEEGRTPAEVSLVLWGNYCSSWEPDFRGNSDQTPYPCQDEADEEPWGFVDCIGCPYCS